MIQYARTVALMIPLLIGTALAQEPAATVAPTQRWNLFGQATSIGQYHGVFRSPYSGDFSLRNYKERDVSLTSTLFLGLRLGRNTTLYFNPEIAGGRGFSGVSGLANSSNGELPRVASATPKPYLARLFLSQDFALGSETESIDGAVNQLAGPRPVKRYTITAGRFTLTDFFDNNRYAHDPRSSSAPRTSPIQTRFSCSAFCRCVTMLKTGNSGRLIPATPAY